MTQHAALITGGAIRVGKAIALHLAEQGYDIAFTYKSHAQEAQEVAQTIESLGRTCIAIEADITSIKTIKNVVTEACTTLPHLNLLVNNAALFFKAPLKEMSEGDYDQHMYLNLKSVSFMMQAFVNNVASGCIINIADSFATQRNASYFPYLLSKKSLLAATELAAHELAPQHKVHAICPGSMMTSDGYDTDYLAHKKQKNPLQQLPTATQVAQTTHMLHQSPWLTGEVLFVDGGEHIQ